MSKHVQVIILLLVMIFPLIAEEVQIGNGTTTTRYIPLQFYYKNSLTESIYLADEFAAGGINAGAITEITYYYNFVEDLSDFPFNIWMGETTLEALPDTWIPAGELTQVFSGTLSFVTGEGEVLIELDEPYIYNGDNLVIMVERVMDTVYYSSSDVFYYEDTPDYPGRSLHKYSDSVDYDPYNPPASPIALSWVPNTLFEVGLDGLGSMNGHVYNSATSEGIPGVAVELTMQERVTAITDANGYYEFPGLLTGDYDAHASLFGYYDETVMVTINEDETTVQDFNLAPFENADITGRVVGSDNPTVGIAGAELSLDGIENYETVSDNDGYFTFSDVYANTVYQLTIVTEFYETYVGEVNLGFVNLDLGDVIVNEISFPVDDVIAEVNDEDTEASLIWHSPVSSNNDFFDFNADDGDFVADQGWEWGTDTNYGNGTNLWGTDLNSQYPNSINYQLVTPEIHISGDDIILTFSHYYDTENYWDGGNVKISTDGGINWTLITPVGGYPEDAASTANAGIPGQACYSADSGGWVTAVFELTAYDGEDVFFKFQFGSDGSGVDGGWFIDDVALCSADREDLTKNNDHLIPVASFSPGYGLERSLEGYRVYRLPYGEEDDETNWVELAEGITDTTYLDLTWAGVDSGLWRYAVKAEYTNEVLSDAEVSNWLGKDMYSDITVNITTNVGDIPAGAEVDLVATVPDPDGNFPQYSGIADDMGVCEISNVWKSTYYMEVALFSFETWEGVIEVIEDEESYDVMVIELAFPPADVEAAINIDGEVDLIWHSPVGASELFFDFEEDDGDFISMAGWAWGTDATAGAYSGTNVWGTVLNGNYAASCNYQLITPEFVVPGDDAVLTFWHWYDTEANLDGGNVKISIDGGNSWTVIHPIGDYPNLTGYSGNAGIPNEPCFTSHNQQYWEFETFEIGEYNGEDAMIKFHFGSDSSVQYPGWFIDDVRVGSPEDRARAILHPGSRALESYSVYRGLNGDEENFEDWDLIAEGLVDTTYEDISWSQITEPDYYKYCVRAEYTNSVLSDPSFSNWLEANFVANVTVNVSTNVGDIPSGAYVELMATMPNPSGEYYQYSGNADDLGIITFSGVYYGNYDLTAELEGYESYEGNIDVDGDMSVDAMITELAFPVYDVLVEEDHEGYAYVSWHSPNPGMETIWDFEEDDGEFISNNAAGWSWGIDNALGANSGEYAWVTALNAPTYINNADWQLTSPEVTIHTEETQLTFYHNMDCENSWDGGNVKISTNGGSTWTLITPEGGYPDDVITGLGEPGYTDGPTGWQLAIFDLSVYEGEDVMFKWHFGTDSSVNGYPGWAIDDVRIGEPETRALEGYSILRGLMGDEANVDNWDLIAENVIDSTYTDETWAEITGSEVYKYAVIAEYTNGVYADAAFSNWLAANMYATLTVNLTTNVGDSPEGALIYLEATIPDPQGGYPEYDGIADEDGVCVISGIWMSNYDIEVELFNFMTYEGNIDIDGDMSVDIVITELNYPPRDVVVEESHTGNAYIEWHSPTGPSGSSWDFEDDNGDFVPEAGWEWAAGSNSGTAYSGENCWSTWPGVDYPNSANTSLYTPEVHVSSDETMLMFYHWYDIENYFDGGNVKISLDEGASWTLITPIEGYPEDAATTSNAGIPGEACYSSSSNGWVYASFDLSAYDGEDVMFRFHFGTDGSVTYLGWDIDDVTIGEPEEAREELSLFSDKQIALSTASEDISRVNRMLEGYNVYRGLEDDMVNFEEWDMIEEAFPDTTMEDETWSQMTVSGVYVYCVRALYTNNIQSEPAFSNPLTFNMEVPVTITVNSNSGDPTSGADVELVNQDGNPQHVYTGVVSGGIISWGNVFRGVYDLTIELEQFELYEQIDISINDATSLNVVLEELIWIPANPVVDENTGIFTWSQPAPATRAYLNQDSSTNNDGIGYSNGGSFTVASRWNPADLTDYDGWYITAVRFFPRSETADYTIKVWSEAGAASLLTDQKVNDFILDEWNEVELGTRAVIDASSELWVGYDILNQKAGDYPVGCDAGPAVAGYGDMIKVGQDKWIAASSLGLNVNWNIQLVISSSNPGSHPVAHNVNKPDPIMNYTLDSRLATGNLSLPANPGLAATTSRSVDYFNVYLEGNLVGQTMQLFFDLSTQTGMSYGEDYTAGVSAHFTSNNESAQAETDFTCYFINQTSGNEIPLTTALTGNYPNPFNPVTLISYQLAADANVQLSIYNTRGQLVKTLVNDNQEPGYYQIAWNGQDNHGKPASSGVYFYRFITDGYDKTSKMILMK
ncbi:MAG: immune inhibitor A [Candidatus Cloacimonetes bacterium]|nr:immune inhibitor A [Candidatus Cloacimonadota bacterium]